MSAPGPPRGWIVSPAVDVALVAIPFVATAAILLGPRAGDGPTPLWAFLLLVVAFDVAHVWATLYISYLDREAFARRRLLFLLPPLLSALVTYRLYMIDPALFWSLLAYVAIHHFASQQWGFVALYRLRKGEGRGFDATLDKWTLWVGALGPVAWWHASAAERAFDWFGHGEAFLLSLPAEIKPEIYGAMGVTAAIYLGRQAILARRGAFNVGKNLWMVASWLSWSLGIGLADHPLVSLACVNLLHGIPFLALVWVRTRNREGGGVVAWLTKRWWLFYGLLFLLAFSEEALWDGLVWDSDYVPGDGVELSRRTEAIVVAILATPQIVHYFLDGFLWKLDGSNPDLDRMLGRGGE